MLLKSKGQSWSYSSGGVEGHVVPGRLREADVWGLTACQRGWINSSQVPARNFISKPKRRWTASWEMLSEADLRPPHICAHTCKYTNIPTQNKSNIDDTKNEAIRNSSLRNKTRLAVNGQYRGWVAKRKGFTIALSTVLFIKCSRNWWTTKRPHCSNDLLWFYSQQPQEVRACIPIHPPWKARLITQTPFQDWEAADILLGIAHLSRSLRSVSEDHHWLGRCSQQQSKQSVEATNR